MEFSGKSKRFPLIAAVLGILIFFVHYSGLISLKIGSASPFLFVPLIISVSYFFGETYGFVFGLALGALCDTVSIGVFRFNTVILMLIGVVFGILSEHFFARNLNSFLFQNIFAAFGYFVLKWLTVYCLNSYGQLAFLFLNEIVPSAVFTSLFAFPFYFLSKYLTGGRTIAV